MYRNLAFLVLAHFLIAALTTVEAFAQKTLPTKSNVVRWAFVGANAQLVAGDEYAPGIFASVRNPCRDQDYVPCGGQGGLYAFDPSYSGPKWKLNEISDDAPPVIKDGVLYLADGEIFAIDPLTGVVLWKNKRDLGVNNHTPIVHDKTIHYWQINQLIPLGIFGGKLIALNTKTHREKWRFPVSDGQVSQPIVSKNSILFGNVGNWRVGKTQSWLYSIDIRTGKQQWKVPSTGGLPVVYNGSVFAVGREGSLQQRELKTGKLMGEHKREGLFTEPILHNDSLIFFSRDGQTLSAFDLKTKKISWERTGPRLYKAPLLFNGQLYFGTDDKILYSVNAIDGKLIWKLELPHAATSSPVIFRGKLYVVCGDGFIYEIDLRDSWR